MIGSLYSGISGLKANTDAMSIIGDNIANVNTTGFKSSKASFADVLSGVTGKEIGQGVMMLGQNTDWTQGAPESTGNATDLAITGDGLFVVRDSAEAIHYTRSGNFQFDNAGNLVTHDGMIVQGYKINPATGTLGAVSNITIESGNCSPLVTSEMLVNLNLNADDTNGLDESVGSTLTVDCINSNSDITFTAISGGTAGNAISIEYADSGVSNQTLSIDVNGFAITVNPATDANGFITSTANDVVDAIAADSDAAALVTGVADGTGEGGVGITAVFTTTIATLNSNVTFTAVNGGAAGDAISVEYIDSSVDGLSVSVAGNTITVDLGGVTPTAADIAAAVNAHADAKLLVSAAAEGTGLGVINNGDTFGSGFLTGGSGISVADLTGGGGAAEATVNCADDNSDVTFTAVNGGIAGNNISIKYVDPGAASQILSVDVDDSNSDAIIITVNLATGAGSAITSTASEIAAAINVKAEAALLVSVAAEGDGAGVVEASASANLTNGVDVADNTPDTYSNTITAYDSKGSAVDITAQYTCVGQGRWVWDVNPSDGLSSSTGVISFDENGKLRYPAVNPTIEITDLSNGAEDLEIEWDLVANNNFTGYALLSSTSSQIQNGYAAGTLQSVSVDNEGFVVNAYSNGKLIPGYRIALAGFSSYDGLSRTGNNLYSESLVSGQPTFGTPGSGSLGGINSRSLEMSNVDLATEFVRMITTQRAFQASSRVITTSDEILQELINLKR